MAREICTNCGQQLWHATDGWSHLHTLRARCRAGRGTAGEAPVATPAKRMYRQAAAYLERGQHERTNLS